MRSMIIATTSSTPMTIPAIAAERRVRKRAARRGGVSAVTSLTSWAIPRPRFRGCQRRIPVLPWFSPAVRLRGLPPLGEKRPWAFPRLAPLAPTSRTIDTSVLQHVHNATQRLHRPHPHRVNARVGMRRFLMILGVNEASSSGPRRSRPGHPGRLRPGLHPLGRSSLRRPASSKEFMSLNVGHSPAAGDEWRQRGGSG